MYHKPVLLREAIELLRVRPEGTYVDATFGSGGHSRAILDKLTQGQVIAFDQDPDALANGIPDGRFTLIQQNFRFIKNFLKAEGISSVDGILADLGISSWQIDQADRGFSTRLDGKLDMRMDNQQELRAGQVVNDYDEEQLADIFYLYGEIENSRQLAREIVRQRAVQPVQTTYQLVAIASRFAPRGKENQYLARVFQAIRIEVNEELEALKEMLQQVPDLMCTGGRIVVISYHSLEDKLVKNYFNTGNFEGKEEKDFFGNLLSPLKPVSRKATRPSEEEINDNPRSRSAKLRAAEKK
jgi:16S rRNA (cytosine1402-N4)-methyltransferase